jgi:hypothetical protein
MGLIHEELQDDEETHYRPKRWYIPKSTSSELLIKKFYEEYNNRAHAQSYERQDILTSRVEWAIGVCEAEGIKSTAQNVSRLLNCSKKQLYTRKDLRQYFVKDDG